MTHLNSTHYKDWKDNGYLKLPAFFNEDEICAIQTWVSEVSSWHPTEDMWMHHYESTEKGARLSRSENFVPYHANLKNIITKGKVIDVVSALMSEPAILYKEKINYKYPGGGGYTAHQDAPAYEFVDYHITCLISVDVATAENGCLDFAPGRHREGFIALDEKGCISPKVSESMDWVAAPTEPGDILLFGSYIPHKSSPNRSSEPRRIIYLTYNAESQGDWHEKYYADKRQTFAQYSKEGSNRDIQISKIAHFQGKVVKHAELGRSYISAENE